MEIIEPIVNDRLSSEFRIELTRTGKCRIRNVVQISQNLLQFVIECPIELKEKVKEIAFMTWIRNPEFQKYYQKSEAFKEIAKEYIEENKALKILQ